MPVRARTPQRPVAKIAPVGPSDGLQQLTALLLLPLPIKLLPQGLSGLLPHPRDPRRHPNLPNLPDKPHFPTDAGVHNLPEILLIEAKNSPEARV